jgi:DNA-3-methyladenine glycosylase II
MMPRSSPDQIKHHLSNDPVLAPLIEHIPFPVLEERLVFASLVGSIISQQLSTKAAKTIQGRLLDLFPESELDPESILALSTDDLRAVGLSRQKSSYIQNVSEFFLEHQLLQADWDAYSDEEVIDLLTQIKGVGRWTVEMVLMFTLNRPDILPVDDLGIQQAFGGLYALDLEQKRKDLYRQMREIALPWAPYRTYASLYLWRWKDDPV